MATGLFFSYVLLLSVLVSIAVCQTYNKVGYARISDVSIDCVQCNMRQLGIMNTCESPKQRHNCTGCMKTFTKVKIKESGEITGKYKTSEVTSRYCMRNGATNVKEEGCYKHPNNGGYTIQCYCYTDNCNSPANVLKPGLPAMLYGLFTAGVIVVTTTRWC